MSIELPEALVESLRRGKCIAFIGSGLSVAAGYPTWESLVRELVDEAMKTPFPQAEGWRSTSNGTTGLRSPNTRGSSWGLRSTPSCASA
jgi:hypothetical protein